MSKIQKELKEIQNEKDMINLINLKIIPLAREKGFELTKKDLISYEKETFIKLSEEAFVVCEKLRLVERNKFAFLYFRDKVFDSCVLSLKG